MNTLKVTIGRMVAEHQVNGAPIDATLVDQLAEGIAFQFHLITVTSTKITAILVEMILAESFALGYKQFDIREEAIKARMLKAREILPYVDLQELRKELFSYEHFITRNDSLDHDIMVTAALAKMMSFRLLG